MNSNNSLDSFLHPLIRPWTGILHAAVAHVEANGLGSIASIVPAFSQIPHRFLAPGIMAFPFLSEPVCDFLSQFSDTQRADFTPNPSELRPYQIPEFVFTPENQPVTYTMLSDAAREALFPLFAAMFCKMPNHFTTIQLAKYNPSDTPGGNWHHDEASEFSAVVSLNPGDFEGGGTELRPAGVWLPPIVLPPLPKGWALLFNGRMTLHQGLPVTSGDRNLLVYWLVDNENLHKWN